MARNIMLTAAVLLTTTAVGWADCFLYTDVVMYQPEVPPGSDPLVPDFNDGSYWTVDVIVTVYGDDDWTATSASASLEDAFFFEHPLGGDTQPDPDLFDETWKRYLLSCLRDELPFDEVPIRLYMRPRTEAEPVEEAIEDVPQEYFEDE